MENYEEAIKDSIVRNLKELEEHDDAYKFSGYVHMIKTVNRCSYATVEDLAKIISRDSDLTQKVLEEVLNIDYEGIVSQAVSKFMEETKAFSVNKNGSLKTNYKIDYHRK
jgi:hypothetical protein